MSNLGFDENNLLSITFSEQLNKEYSLNFSGYQIKSHDKWILIYNKRQRRVIHLKEVSEGMQVAYLQKKVLENFSLDISMMENTLAIFQGFNEESGEKYHYLPFFSKNVDEFSKELKTLFWISIEISKESQGTFIRNFDKEYSFPKEKNQILSFLFALVFVYWKFDGKSWAVSAVKSHIPLVWWTRIAEELEETFNYLAKEYWVFISSQRVQNWNKTVFQFSSNDKQLLALFVDWMNEVKKDTTLSLTLYSKKQQEIKDQLVEYITTASETNLDWKDEVLKLIKENEIKFIKYL